MKNVNNALLSVYDKRGLEAFAKGLVEQNINIISTGGTANILEQKGIKTTKVEEITNFPEILDGRVKTLNHKIHGGILAKRDNKEHLKVLTNLEIPMIDLVVVNLYPFEDIRKQSVGDENKIIEGIDIGGSTLIRAAAKNFRDVIVVVDPEDYASILDQIRQKNSLLSFRKELAKKAFQHTCYYDAAISDYFFCDEEKVSNTQSHDGLESESILIHLRKVQRLKYGENPHQRASVYVNLCENKNPTILESQLQGNEISFNNLLDIETAFQCVSAVKEKCCTIVKHNNPCGAAIGNNSLDAFQKAKECDQISFFGGVVAFNHEIDEELAKLLTSFFLEVVIATNITAGAKTLFRKKKNLKVFSHPVLSQNKPALLDIRKLNELYLVQESDGFGLEKSIDLCDNELTSVTSKVPSARQIRDARFAWHIAKFVKSNAIVLCKDLKTIGIGAGQTSRIDATRIAIKKALDNGFDLKDAVVASDAFFPFKDNIEEIATSGASCIIQPGGSIKDEEVVATAQKLGVSMILTKMRHFRH